MEIEGNPWFVAKDVCEVLSYRPHPNGGYQNTLRIVSSDEKKVLEKAHSPGEWVLFEGTSSRVALISESGLYKLDDGEKTIVPPNLHLGKGMNKATLIKRDSRILNTRDMDFIHVCSMSSALLGFSASP